MDSPSNKFEIVYSYKDENITSFQALLESISADLLIHQISSPLVREVDITNEVELNEENWEKLYALTDFNHAFKLLTLYLNDCGFKIEKGIKGFLALEGSVFQTYRCSFIVEIETLKFVFDFTGTMNVKLQSNTRYSYLTHQYNLPFLDILLEDHYSLEKFTKWLKFMVREFK